MAFNDARDVALAVKATKFGMEFPDLHPSTDPESIAQDQRDVVGQYLGLEPEAISDLVDLPVSVVVRRIGEILKQERKGDSVIYMKCEDGGHRIIVLESANLEELKKGRPAKTPDGSVLICWTPDPVWLADKIMDSGGDAVAIGKLIEESAKRPQRQEPRPTYGTHVKDFRKDNK